MSRRTMKYRKLAFVASEAESAGEACARLRKQYGHADPAEADVIIALGGDGFMLQTLHSILPRQVPIYGMNQGTVGFLMNEYAEDDLVARLDHAEAAVVHPLEMAAVRHDGAVENGLAINEVSILRETRFAAKIRIVIDGRERMSELICDGVMVATPAGSTAYNFSAHGPIVPVDANVLALTPISAFRPRRWRGALLPRDAKVRFEVLEADRRPVSAVADMTEVRDVISVDVRENPSISLNLLFDPEHNLEERILSEQFAP